METQRFPTSKEVQSTEVIKQGVCVRLSSGTKMELLVDNLERDATTTAEYYVALADKLKH
jgi:hypothetical protein